MRWRSHSKKALLPLNDITTSSSPPSRYHHKAVMSFCGDKKHQTTAREETPSLSGSLCGLTFNLSWSIPAGDSGFFFSYRVGVHCGIYKSSSNVSNISYLNSPPPPLSFIPHSHSWNSFNRYHFSIYIHVYTVFVPYSPSHTLSPPPPHSHWYQHHRQDLFCPPVLQFCKRKKMTFLFV
jgi:hypothetical protein